VRVLSTAQMREADRATIHDLGIPSIVLMENAGRQVAAAVESHFGRRSPLRIAVLSGRGSNGGDGSVAARALHQNGHSLSLYLIGTAAQVTGDARLNLDVLGRLQVPIYEVATAGDWELHAPELARHDVIIDALCGTGVSGPLTGLFASVVDDVNASGVPVVAIDLPSGLSADTSEVPGPAIEAAVTVTLGAPKLPLLLPPAETLAGDIVVADIGIPHEAIESVPGDHTVFLTRDALRPSVNPRPSDSHKGDYGRVLIVAGSVGKTGAAVLAAQGALRSGAGLVTIACPERCLPVIASQGLEFMTMPLPERPGGGLDPSAADLVLEADADVLVIGPGLGRDRSTQEVIRAVVERSGAPMVIDADALFAFSGDGAPALTGSDERVRIITPHAAEMARLIGADADDVQAHRVEVARRTAIERHLHVVLKGHRTLVASPDGHLAINPTGTPGMATGGTGDVLAGVLGSWLAQTMDADQAACLAVFLHGAAGELAARDVGEAAMLAGDLVAHLGDALLELMADEPSGEA
jgi:NAD(P)H-hydrate epimerase